MWSTNSLERPNREIKRRADVVRVFPNPGALYRLAAAALAELHYEWQVFDRRHLSEASMTKLFTTKPTEPEAQITQQPAHRTWDEALRRASRVVAAAERHCVEHARERSGTAGEQQPGPVDADPSRLPAAVAGGRRAGRSAVPRRCSGFLRVAGLCGLRDQRSSPAWAFRLDRRIVGPGASLTDAQGARTEPSLPVGHRSRVVRRCGPRWGRRVTQSRRCLGGICGHLGSRGSRRGRSSHAGVVSERYGRGSPGGSGRADGDRTAPGPDATCSARRQVGRGATVRRRGGQ
ncbi:transposase [Streptomyces phaeochromogenes]|uniref:transposase n=1 Tax=Streptomyces phaeochromogenes TaxID=1923 RepID=UPI0036A39F21